MAQLTTAQMNELPDSAFAYIEPGGTKDSSGRTVPRSNRHYVIVDAEHVRAALARIAQRAEFWREAMPKVMAAARKFNIEVSDDMQGMMASRAADAGDRAWPEVIRRAYPTTDATLQRGRVTCESCGQDATGRMVDAYVSVFGQDAEIFDEAGHYWENIDPGAYARRLEHLSRANRGVREVGVFYNHGHTIYGTPAPEFSLPLGHPSAIRADTYGLLSSTHYTHDPLADRILNHVLDGTITGHSFTGRIYRSDPPRVPRAMRGGTLTRVVRLELGLSEYGPTPMENYAGAQLVAVRSDLATGLHSDGSAGYAPPPPPDAGLGAADSQDALRAAQDRHAQARRRARLAALGVHHVGTHS